MGIRSKTAEQPTRWHSVLCKESFGPACCRVVSFQAASLRTLPNPMEVNMVQQLTPAVEPEPPAAASSQPSAILVVDGRVVAADDEGFIGLWAYVADQRRQPRSTRDYLP